MGLVESRWRYRGSHTRTEGLKPSSPRRRSIRGLSVDPDPLKERDHRRDEPSGKQKGHTYPEPQVNLLYDRAVSRGASIQNAMTYDEVVKKASSSISYRRFQDDRFDYYLKEILQLTLLHDRQGDGFHDLLDHAA